MDKVACVSAVLAAIASNDAVCMRLGSIKPVGTDEQPEAAPFLLLVCRGTEWEAQAAGMAEVLERIIRHNVPLQWDGGPLSAREAERLYRRCGRFIDWSERILASA